MKILVIGCLCAATAGTYALGGIDSPDVDKVVSLPPGKVYDGFSGAIGPAGTILSRSVRGPDGNLANFSAIVRKKDDESVELFADFGDRRAFRLRIDLSAEKGGRATRVRAKADADAALFSRLDGVPPQPLLDAAIHYATVKVVSRAIGEIEAGRPVTPIEIYDINRTSLHYREAYAGESVARPGYPRGDGSRSIPPMQRARPMVNPNAAARAFLRN